MQWFGRKSDNQSEKNLIEQQSKKWHQIFKNRLFLTSLLNAIIFLLFVFAMAYYDWGQVSVPTLKLSSPTVSVTQVNYYQIYFNLLYVKFPNEATYQSFASLAQICIANDLMCQAAATDLQFVGYLCFSLLGLGAVFQIYDICRMVYFLYRIRETNEHGYEEEKQDNVRHMISIGAFVVGLTLNVFGMVMMGLPFTYGVSFGVFVASLACFIGIIIYQQFSLHKIKQQKLILDLIQGERTLAHRMSMNIELSSEAEAYI